MTKKVGWLPLVGAVLLFLALIGLIIVFRKSRTMILPTREKWEIHAQVQAERAKPSGVANLIRGR